MPEPDTENKDWPEVQLWRDPDDAAGGLPRYGLGHRTVGFPELERYLPLQVVRDRLLKRAYAAGGKRAREHRLGIRHDEEGFEHRDAHEELPDGLCSADMMAAYAIVSAALDEAFPEQEER